MKKDTEELVVNQILFICTQAPVHTRNLNLRSFKLICTYRVVTLFKMPNSKCCEKVYKGVVYVVRACTHVLHGADLLFSNFFLMLLSHQHPLLLPFRVRHYQFA